jgi:hypothetical protein
MFGATGVGTSQTNTGTTAAIFMQRLIVNVSAPNASVQFYAGTFGTQSMDCTITSYNPAATVEEEEEAEAEEKDAAKSPPELIKLLLGTGKSVHDLQRMIEDKGFTPEKKRLEPSNPPNLSNSASSTVLELLERIKQKREADARDARK